MKEKLCGIYSITNIINNKRIIGMSKNISRRWASHKSELKRNIHRNSYLQRAWNKYKENNFKFEIIYLCKECELNDAEVKFIKEFNTMNRNFGYNLKEGGNCSEMADETREKISAFRKGTKASLETRKRQSESKMGNKNHNYGKPMSEETKQKISNSLLGRKSPLLGTHKTEEVKQKNSGSNHYLFGKHPSEETKQKMKKAKTGINNPLYGKKHSEETKQKMRMARLNKREMTTF